MVFRTILNAMCAHNYTVCVCMCCNQVKNRGKYASTQKQKKEMKREKKNAQKYAQQNIRIEHSLLLMGNARTRTAACFTIIDKSNGFIYVQINMYMRKKEKASNDKNGLFYFCAPTILYEYE